ncbi:MAG: uroporphyrinogen decarboxylase family protein [Anaerolineae bacterium]|nr:uroporphyrinogen decarboxylase family protein [Anaerolineae bacterium]
MSHVAFSDLWQTNARLALDSIAMRPTQGIPTWMINVMEWSHLETFSGHPPGSYQNEPVKVYLDFMRATGISYIDQWIPENPLTMAADGYQSGTARSATTGAKHVRVDGKIIDSPESVVDHMETVLFPRWSHWRTTLDAHADVEIKQRIQAEVEIQKQFGTDMVKGPYSGFFTFPSFLYGLYGYENYFMAYALYPEVIERGFSQYADVATVYNRIGARAICEGGLPRLVRFDHDMADSRGTLVDIKSLDRLWFPHFCRAIQPFLDADIRLIWHCDGNLMEMVPRLIDAGIGGFQGFQYEDGMDYRRICQMKTRDGDGLFIIAGVSVTTTLPHGTPAAVRREMRWLVDNGPPAGLMLGCSSSVTPGVPLKNMQALFDGFAYFRTHGRG